MICQDKLFRWLYFFTNCPGLRQSSSQPDCRLPGGVTTVYLINSTYMNGYVGHNGNSGTAMEISVYHICDVHGDDV